MLVTEPIFTVKTPDGTRKEGLFDALDLALHGQLIDLPAMRAHQRAAVVTVLSAIVAVLRRYGDENLETEWRRQIGEAALRLVAPHDEVAFFQPPTDEPRKRLSLDALDCILPSVQHEVKESFAGTAEQWVFALIGGLARPSVNYNRPSSRVGLTVVLVSEDGTIGSEIERLVNAYLAMPNGTAGPACEHMVWLQRLDPSSQRLLAADLPRPFLDVGRPVRLIDGPDGIEAWFVPSNVYRVDQPSQWHDEPQTPRLIGKDAVDRFRLAAKRWDHRVQHQMLFGGIRGDDEIRRPDVLHLVDYRYVRICALGTAQGKTLGYHERLYAAGRSKGGFRLGPPADQDRPSELSRRALEATSTGENQLAAALLHMLGVEDFNTLQHRPHENAIVRRAQGRLSARAGEASVQLTFDLLQQAADLEREQQAINSLVAGATWEAFLEAQGAIHDRLAVATAEDYLRGAIRRKFGELSMESKDDIPTLARRSYAILGEIVEHLTPDDRARLRTMSLSEPPIEFWMHLAAAPKEQSEQSGCVAVWKPILRALGSIRQADRNLGRLLAETEYPRDRVSRFLTATGGALVGAIDESMRWLLSHDIDRADLSTALSLGLADALGDLDARDWARRRIALDYVRKARRMQQAA